MRFLDVNTKAHDVFLPHNMKTQDTCFIDAIDRLIILKKTRIINKLQKKITTVNANDNREVKHE